MNLPKPRPNQILTQPATANSCLADYTGRDPKQRSAEAREQKGQAQTEGNANAKLWKGHK